MTKPTPNGLDLDALEREGDRPEPYTFTAGGRQFTCTAPDEVDWQTVVDLDITNPRAVMSAYLGDDYQAFADIRIPQWKVEKLLEAVDAHYGGGVDQGEGEGSPTS